MASQANESNGPETTQVQFVRSKPAVTKLVSLLRDLPTDPPSIYIDSEGGGQRNFFNLIFFVTLGGNSRTIYIVPYHPNIYFHSSFSSYDKKNGANQTNPTTLASILDDGDIPKVGFDLQSLASSLSHRSDGKLVLEGVWDLQLMQLACRGCDDTNNNLKYVVGFNDCAGQALPRGNALKQKWFQPALGADGTEENLHMFNVMGHVSNRTMRRVELYPSLWDAYHRRKLAAHAHAHAHPRASFWLQASQRESDRRVRKAASQKGGGGGFNPAAKDNAVGPRGWWDKSLLGKAIRVWEKEKEEEEEIAKASREIGINIVFEDD